MEQLQQPQPLVELGVAPGPEIGRVLRAVYEQQLDGAVTSVEEARALAGRMLGDRG